MGRANRTDDLFYSDSFGPIIDPLDSQEPSDDTMLYVDDLLRDVKGGRVDAALYAMQLVQPEGDISEYPALQKLMSGLVDDQVRKIFRQGKFKLKEKGAKAEQAEIIAGMLSTIQARFWASPETDPETGEEIPLPPLEDRVVVEESDVALAALQSEANPSPIADQYRDRIASTGIFSLDEEFLRTALQPSNSDKTKDAVADSLKRDVVKEAGSWAQRFSIQSNVATGHRPSSVPYGVARSSSKGPSILHLRDEDAYWKSICGKKISRGAAYGSWKDAASGAQYRRCASCEEAASAKLRKKAESQSASAAANYFPSSVSDRVDKISESKEITDILSKWSKGSDDADSLRQEVRSEISRQLTPIMTEVVDSKDIESDYGHPLINMVPSVLRRELQNSGHWNYTDKDQMRKLVMDVFPEEAREKIVKSVMSSSSSSGYGYYRSQLGEEMTDYLKSFVDDYIAKNPAPDPA